VLGQADRRTEAEAIAQGVYLSAKTETVMDKTIRKFSNFDELKAEEYRYWQSRPVHERWAATEELSLVAYASNTRNSRQNCPEHKTLRSVCPIRGARNHETLPA